VTVAASPLESYSLLKLSAGYDFIDPIFRESHCIEKKSASDILSICYIVNRKVFPLILEIVAATLLRNARTSAIASTISTSQS
jgi:hypothetical protein